MSAELILKELQSINTFFLDQLPGLYGVKDLNSNYVVTNQLNAKTCGFKKPENMCGVTDYELKCGAVLMAEYFQHQDKVAIDKGEMVSLEYLNCKGGEKLFLSEKKPFLTHKKEIVGSCFHLTELTHYHLIDIARFLIKTDIQYHQKNNGQFTYALNSTDWDVFFTKRQAECLFFLLRGKSAKVIAKILNLSHRTIEDYIEKIKMQLGCQTKSELFEKAYLKGYMSILPKSLMDSKLIAQLNMH